MRKLLIVLSILAFVACCFFASVIYIPSQAQQIYGPPAAWLTLPQRIQYSAKLLWDDGLLTRPLYPTGITQTFVVEQGESVSSIATRLEQVSLIRDAGAFRDYLVYSGFDTTIQSGTYQLSPTTSAIDIARKLQDATSAQVKFVVLPGWRMEEIAASLPTSGLSITPDDFLSAARTSFSTYDFLAGASSAEGFLFPDTYVLPRTASTDDLVNDLLRNFGLHLSPDLKNGFEKQGLTVYQAVTLASIVQREAVKDEEAPMIASVYLNRLRVGMKLEADPTVQYALGYNAAQSTWWTNPLSALDLQFDSPFNTYMYGNLPPTPISNPGLTALSAVAFPAETSYYFFRAKCDGSGYHLFAETFDEHLANGCQ